MSKYRHHKYTFSYSFGSDRHHWEIVGPIGGLHFHASISKDYSPSCGLEFHHGPACFTQPDEAPHHVNCPLIGGPCWHDGTSLYATEQLWPIISSYLETGDHKAIFELLEGEADRHFAQYERKP